MTHSHDLNRTVRLYIGFLAATAVAVIALTVGAAPADYSPAQLVTAAALGAALVVAQRFPIHLTDKTKVCVDTTILIASVLLLSPALAIATAATSAAIYELVARISWEQAVFNVAQTVIYITAGAWIFQLLADPGSPPALTNARVLTGAIAGIVVMHLLNTAAVAGVEALQLGKSPAQFWLEGISIDLPEHAVLAANGILLAAAAGTRPWLLPLLAGPLVLVYLSLRQSAELRETTRAMLDALADLSDLLGREPPGHSRRVTDRTRQLADQLGLTSSDADVAIRAARLRGLSSVGANGNPRSVSTIDADRAAQLVATLPSHGAVAVAVRHQHERWDGSGRPDGLSGEAIPLPARLVAVADAFERIRSRREASSRRASPEAAELLSSGSGGAWDPRVVSALSEVVGIRSADPA